MKRRWILWLLIVLFVWVVISRFAQIKQLAETLALGHWVWVLVATLLEGVMTLVYTSLGVPASTATVISIAFRGLSFWLPLLVGFVLVRQVKSFHPDRNRGDYVERTAS